MDANAQLRRRKAWRTAGITVVALLAVVAAADHLGAFGYRGDDWAEFDRAEAKLSRVIDPVTIEVISGKRVQTVRLLGIEPPGAANQWATEHLESLLKNRTFHLKLEQLQPRDASGRLVAYVFLSTDDNLNLDLIRDGYARADRHREHTMRSMFELAESLAKKAKRGIWADE